MSDLLLRLYVAGNSPASQRAGHKLSELQRLIPGCRTEIIDVLARPELAEYARILATPTLSYEHPQRPRRIIGDLSDTRRVLEFLGVEVREKKA